MPEPAGDEKKENQEKKTENTSTKAEKTDKKSEKPSEKPAEKSSAKPSEKVHDQPNAKNKKSCSSHPVINDKSLKGGKKAGKFRYFKNVKEMKPCIAKCCALDKNCDVAFMEDGKCYSISCFKKGLCMSVEKRPEDPAVSIAYMDHFISKAEETEDAENDQGIGM